MQTASQKSAKLEDPALLTQFIITRIGTLRNEPLQHCITHPSSLPSLYGMFRAWKVQAQSWPSLYGKFRAQCLPYMESSELSAFLIWPNVQSSVPSIIIWKVFRAQSLYGTFRAQCLPYMEVQSSVLIWKVQSSVPSLYGKFRAQSLYGKFRAQSLYGKFRAQSLPYRAQFLRSSELSVFFIELSCFPFKELSSEV